jgi:hypothetical protein
VRDEHGVRAGGGPSAQPCTQARGQVAFAVKRALLRQQVRAERRAPEGEPRGVARAAVRAGEHPRDGDPQRPERSADGARLAASGRAEVALARAIGVVARLVGHREVGGRVAKGDHVPAAAQICDEAAGRLRGRCRDRALGVGHRAIAPPAAGGQGECQEQGGRHGAPHGAMVALPS